MKNLIIRKFKSEDRPILEELFEEFGDYFIDIDPMKRLRKGKNYGRWSMDLLLKKTKEKGTILVAELNNEVVGYISGALTSQSEEELMEVIPTKFGSVLEFQIKKDYQRKGIGKILMKEIINYFKKNNCEMVRLTVFSPNKIARNFYKKLGFQDRLVDVMKKI